MLSDAAALGLELYSDKVGGKESDICVQIV